MLSFNAALELSMQDLPPPVPAAGTMDMWLLREHVAPKASCGGAPSFVETCRIVRNRPHRNMQGSFTKSQQLRTSPQLPTFKVKAYSAAFSTCLQSCRHYQLTRRSLGGHVLGSSESGSGERLPIITYGFLMMSNTDFGRKARKPNQSSVTMPADHSRC